RGVTGGQMSALCDALGSSAHIPIDVARRDINENKTDKLAVLAPNAGRSSLVADVSQKFDRHLRAGWRRHKNALECAQVPAEIARVSCVHRITLPALDRGRDRLAADRGFNDVVHILHGETVTRGGFAIDREVEEIAARCA